MAIIYSSSGRPAFRTDHPKSIWKYTDDELKSVYGECWDIAREMIDEHNCFVKSGLYEDWSKWQTAWRGQEPTERQIQVLIANGITGRYDKADASILIDQIMFDEGLKREVERYNIRVEKEAQKEARRKAREEEQQKREYQKKVKNSANIESVKKSFVKLWNKLLEDDKFTEPEIYKLKTWCIAHKHLKDDFTTMIELCDKVVEDHDVNVDEMQELYAEAEAMVGRMTEVV